MRFAILALAVLAFAASAADFPAPQEGTWTVRDFRFHTGEALPELKLAYRTIGAPSGEPGAGLPPGGAGGVAARHARLWREQPPPGLRRRALRRRPAARREALLHHPA